METFHLTETIKQYDLSWVLLTYSEVEFLLAEATEENLIAVGGGYCCISL
jgi:hypothetical protein